VVVILFSSAPSPLKLRSRSVETFQGKG